MSSMKGKKRMMTAICTLANWLAESLSNKKSGITFEHCNAVLSGCFTFIFIFPVAPNNSLTNKNTWMNMKTCSDCVRMIQIPERVQKLCVVYVFSVFTFDTEIENLSNGLFRCSFVYCGIMGTMKCIVCFSHSVDKMIINQSFYFANAK